jgi:cellulose synthase/poly-beta-1,6-N-acetylglucosamine synthase-like glycosyltransferase
MNVWQYSLLAVYALGSLGLMLYGTHCYLMSYLFLRRQKGMRCQIQAEVEAFNQGRGASDYPRVTIQLPVYNEKDVVERLIRSAAEIDYPREAFEIQVLDDSQDETREIVDRTAAELREQGICIEVVRRPLRTGFKAGALAYATARARGEYMAIFDADFIVPREFLKRTIALIHNHSEVACVQGRWGHTNRLENWLTRAQSVGIDGHFAAEQGARSYNQLCMNFNGTAGIWRKSAIEAVGGWQGDTLTEDLDLSYRVQLAGYQIRFDFDLECPAELPNHVVAFKSQQRRWAKGSMETAIKLLPAIFSSKRLTWGQKFEAFLHLTHYSVAVLMVLICCLTLPVLLWVPVPSGRWVITALWTIIALSAMAPCFMYTISGMVLRRGWFSLAHFPAMLVTGTGLCLNNALAVFEALIGYKSDFVRTPKSWSIGKVSKAAVYQVNANFLLAVGEIALGLYCLLALNAYTHAHKYVFGFFIAAYGVGLLTFGLMTLKTCLFRIRPSVAP